MESVSGQGIFQEYETIVLGLDNRNRKESSKTKDGRNTFQLAGCSRALCTTMQKADVFYTHPGQSPIVNIKLGGSLKIKIFYVRKTLTKRQLRDH
jgi:hypothetical protein